MLARECVPENAGVAGYAEAFRGVLSGKQASIQSSYLRTAILEKGGDFLKRKAIADLVRWKSSEDRKPLVLKGARQVGKTPRASAARC